MTTPTYPSVTDEMLEEIEEEMYLATKLDCNAAVTHEHLRALLSDLSRLRAENAELKSENLIIRARSLVNSVRAVSLLSVCQAENRAVIAHSSELAKDAGRYRWLFADDASWSGELEYAVFDDGRKPVVDSAIDAAMEQTK